MKKLNQEAVLQAEDRLLNIREAAELLSMSTYALRAWRFNGTIPVVMVGRCVRFRLSDLQRIMREGLPLRGKE